MSLKLWPLKVATLFFKNYVYLLSDTTTGSAALVDPVWDRNKITNILEMEQLRLTAIFLTHSHHDHTQLADTMARTYGCPVYMSREEIDYYQFRCHNLAPFTEGLKLGSLPVRPLLTPGHTRGSTCFLIDNNLFSGDTLFIEGCGLCWGDGADPGEMYESLQYLKHQIPFTANIWPGHSFGAAPGKTFQYVLENNIYLDFRDKESFIKYRMRKKQGLLFAFK